MIAMGQAMLQTQKGVERAPPYALITFSQAAVVAGEGVWADCGVI